MTSWLIGSAPDCDLVVDKPAVSGRHCRLTQRLDGFYLQDLDSTNGTFVNGQRLTTITCISRDDVVTLGGKIPLPWPAPAGNSQIISIGQASDNDIVIDRATVSGHHARIVISGPEMVLEDLGSTNGTFLGSTSRRIEKAAVRPDDRVFFGTYEVEVRKLLEKVTAPTARVRAPASDKAQSTRPHPVTHVEQPSGHSPDESSRAIEMLMPVLGGVALLVICVVGVMMMLSSSKDVAVTASDVKTVSASSGPNKQQAKRSEVRVGFIAGSKAHSRDAVERIKVTIHLGSPPAQDLKEPLDLDLGGEFLLRLTATAGDQSTATAVALPQKFSLEPNQSTIKAGSSASFEFSTEDEQDSAGRSSTTPFVLADFWYEQIRTIRFAAVGRTNWVLEGYEIEINGKLFAAHDSVNWRVVEQVDVEKAKLKELLGQRAKLEEQISILQGAIETGQGKSSYEADLNAKKEELARLSAAIDAKQADITGPQHWYTENSPHFRPPKSGD